MNSEQYEYEVQGVQCKNGLVVYYIKFLRRDINTLMYSKNIILSYRHDSNFHFLLML